MVEQYETLNFGVALTAASLLDVKSDLLGTTLGEHLKKHKLIWDLQKS